MKQHTKLSHESQHAETHQSHAQAGQEFASVEELLRLDATQTAVPPQIAERLKRSAQNAAPAQSRPWWKNIFGQ